MARSANIGAIDAGSNAIRVVVASVTEGGDPQKIAGERVPVRLGHGAFTVGELDIHTIDAAVQAFQSFRDLFAENDVTHYRAVTTSAVRSSRNRDILLHRIFAEAGINLEMITGEEEARLIRKAVRNAFRGRPAPATVLDLGGGSLEVNVRNVSRWNAASLPIGTVRLMETFGLTSTIGDDEARMVRRYASTLLHVFAPDRKGLSFEPAVACGGNAERFAKLIGDTDDGGMRYFDLTELERIVPEILASDVPGRMRTFNVRKDRAEVMGVAALVLATCGKELGIERMFVPCVGLRDALLFELGSTKAQIESHDSRAKALLTASRMFAARLGHDLTHGERVRELARSMYDQLAPLHGLGPELRVVLEVAALLHDIGEVIHGRSHHKHGEYMVRWGRITGLESPHREMVAALIRGHRKSLPTVKKHDSYAELTDERKAIVRKMLGILRVADALDTDHRQRVVGVAVSINASTVELALSVASGSTAMVQPETFLRKSEMLETELGKKVTCAIGD